MVSRFFPSAVIALLLPFTASAFGVQALIEGRMVTFVDVPQTAWFAEHVRQAAELGIVSGYRDLFGVPTGNFGPEKSITIAEALKIASEGAGYDEELYSARVQSGIRHWSSSYISVARAEQFAVINDRDEGPRAFNPDRPAQRAEVAAIFTSAFRVDTERMAGTRYRDVPLDMQYAMDIEALSQDGVLSGDADVRGRPIGTFGYHNHLRASHRGTIIVEK